MLKCLSISTTSLATLFLLPLIFCAIASGLVLACLPPHYGKDASDKLLYWGGYTPDATYKLKEDVFISVTAVFTIRYVLVPPRAERVARGLHNSPESIEEYRRNSNDWPKVVGVVDKGTRIKVTTITEEGVYLKESWHKTISVYAKILDGDHADQVVEIKDLSRYVTDEEKKEMGFTEDLRLYAPEPKFLELYDGETQEHP